MKTEAFKTWRLLLLALLPLAAFGQSVEPTEAPAATTPPVVAPAQSPLSETEAAMYRIGPGDVLQVFVWRNPELTVSVPVRPDGKISTPLVEDMVAIGKTPTELARDIETVLGEYIRSPQVSIIVMTPQSQFSQVKVVGQVAHPAPLPYRSGMTVLDAVLAAGGMTQFAAGNRTKIVRTENGKQVEIKVKLDDIVNDGDIKQNVEVRPGDLVVVPESRW
jgi:polysaccharide biosynthesis/export protein